MTKITILLLCGGGSTEHDVSIISANYIEQQLSSMPNINVIRVEIKSDAWFFDNGELAHFDINQSTLNDVPIDYVIPCIHGYPGETGDIQSLLELAHIPYLGCSAEASINCFNKITSKLWYDALAIPNTPYLFLTDASLQSKQQALDFFTMWGKVFVKAAKQGSSVGCYPVTDPLLLNKAIDDAFHYSDQILIEQSVITRELEVAVYQYDNQLQITKPGEVITPSGNFYSYDEKYSNDSHSVTKVEAEDLTLEQQSLIMSYAQKVFTHMKLKDMARIDFFLTDDGHIYLNEINTFPGMTPISMFPKMLEHNNHQFSAFLKQAIDRSIKR